MVKLDDISADHIAGLPNEPIFEAVSTWAAEYDPELAELLATERERALLALTVERDGVENPRKDLRKWSEFRAVYGFFFPGLFTLVESFADERLAALKLTPAAGAAFLRDFVGNYASDLDGDAWFDQIRTAARANGFALTAAELREAPDQFVGLLRDAAQLVRVAITGSTKSPDLYAISQAMGPDEFCRRLRPLSA